MTCHTWILTKSNKGFCTTDFCFVCKYINLYATYKPRRKGTLFLNMLFAHHCSQVGIFGTENTV